MKMITLLVVTDMGANLFFVCPPACRFCAGITDGVCTCGSDIRASSGFCMNSKCPHFVDNYCKSCGGNNDAVGLKNSIATACEC
jgi:hypothetical protein